MKGDPASVVKGYVADEIGEVAFAELLLRRHHLSAFSGDRGSDVNSGFAFSVELTRHFRSFGNYEFFIWIVSLKLEADFVIQLQDSRRHLRPLFAPRNQEPCVVDDSIHQHIDLLQKLRVANTDLDSALVICTHPAFTDAVFGADAPFHGCAALLAANIIPQEVDCPGIFLKCIALSGGFQADRRFVECFINNGVIFIIAGVFGIVDDSGDTRFILGIYAHGKSSPLCFYSYTTYHSVAAIATVSCVGRAQMLY